MTESEVPEMIRRKTKYQRESRCPCLLSEDVFGFYVMDGILGKEASRWIKFRRSDLPSMTTDNTLADDLLEHHHRRPTQPWINTRLPRYLSRMSTTTPATRYHGSAPILRLFRKHWL